MISILFLTRRTRKLLVPVMVACGLTGNANAADVQPVVEAQAELLQQSTQPVAYSPRATTSDYLQRKIYLGLGMGRSWLEPDTSEIDGVDPNDRVQLGTQLTLGLVVNKWASLEVHAADLGDAGLSNGGSVGYQQFGASGLFYIGSNRHRYNRRGLTGYARAGVGLLSNSTTGDFDHSTENAAHLLLGAGAEYASYRGLAVRAEAIIFDADVNLLQLGLVYRFGKRKKREIELLVVNEAQPEIQTPVVAAPVAAVVVPVAVADNDHDGVSDAQDFCPDSAPGAAVDDRGCALFNSAIEGVNFHSNSNKLTQSAMLVLDEVIGTLLRYPDVNFELSAHTDSSGKAESNQRLSERRADSVALYLTDSGIERQRFTVSAFGETRPIADNATPAGRLLNRRVELVQQ